MPEKFTPQEWRSFRATQEKGVSEKGKADYLKAYSQAEQGYYDAIAGPAGVIPDRENSPSAPLPKIEKPKNDT